jgi:hypothetical protein
LQGAVFAVGATRIVNNVFMGLALRVNPNDIVTLVHVIGTRHLDFVGAVQRFGVRRRRNVQPPKVHAPARKAREANFSD